MITKEKTMTDENKHLIAMSGATGFIGSHLRQSFEMDGWDVLTLGRHDFEMSPEELAGKMKGVDTVVNLAGAPVIKRWTEEYKNTMYKSRVNTTKSLVLACSHMDPKPKLFISTSAIGYYASGGPHTENNHVKANGFLGHLARDWEKEALTAKELGIRTVIFRFGVVLGKDGGALKEMLTPFKLGVGGTIGDGSQPFSWVHIRDLIHAFQAAVDNESYEGTYNLTAPKPTTNKGLTKALGKALGKPTIMQVPKFVLRLQLGEGSQVLTEGQTVFPERLVQSGFSFSFNNIEDAVKDCVA
jgi:uncharacterized protein (TIGR01777 family)